jgi:hypothetical protein
VTARARPGRARTRVLASALVSLAFLAAGCAPGASPSATAAERPVTAEEAQLLAVARFKNFDAGTRSVSLEVQDSGHALAVTGWFDYATGIGYGALSDSGTPNSLISWEGHVLAIHSPAGGAAPLPAPGVADTLDSSWRTGPLDPTASTLHAALVFVAELGSTRPENPLLLQQGGVLWLRDDSVDGTPVTVFTGPTGLATAAESATEPPASSRVRYWVDGSGLLLRVEVLLGAAWVRIDLGRAEDVSLGWTVAEPTA